MRVIAGTARSLPLKTVKGDATRPTTDRIKETLFNMLNPYVPGARFLDLFAGSGGIGIEALSRGAVHAVFVDNQKEAVKCITENLQFTRLLDKAEVMSCDVMTAILRLSDRREEPFDVIFLDPPYDNGLEEEVLRALSKSPLVNEDTLIVFEASLKTDISVVEDLGYELLKDKKYKTNRHAWVRKEI